MNFSVVVTCYVCQTVCYNLTMTQVSEAADDEMISTLGDMEQSIESGLGVETMDIAAASQEENVVGKLHMRQAVKLALW